MTAVPIPSRGALLAAALSFLLFACAASWGTPYATGADRVKAWGIDDESPLGPLAEIHNILHPKPNQWLSYPLLYSFVTGVAYAPYLLYLAITGGFSHAAATFPFGLTDPVTGLRHLTLIAHLVSAAMASLAVAAAYDIGAVLVGKPAGALYALLVATSFPLIYYARNGNVDATALAMTALATALFCRLAALGFNEKLLMFAAAFAGLALAAKESSIGILLAMPVLLFRAFRRQSPHVAIPWRSAARALAIAFVAFGLGSGLFVDPKRYFAHLAYLRSLLSLVASANLAWPTMFQYDGPGHLGYLAATTRNAADALGLPGLLLAAFGAGMAILRRTQAALPATLAATYLLYLFATYRLVQVRYLMPFTFLALFYVAYAAHLAWHSRTPALRACGLLFAALAAGRSSLVALDYTHQMLFDSRYAAAHWIERTTQTGDAIAYFGAESVLPPIPAAVATRRATEFRGMYFHPRIDDAKIAEILGNWRREAPSHVLVMPDHTSPPGIPYSHTLPPRLYSHLINGEAGYHLAATFQTGRLFPWLPLPPLDYPTVNPPIRIFRLATGVQAESR